MSSLPKNNNNNNHNNNRSWFEGTMEVISGMAPRPSTPQPQHHGDRNHPPSSGSSSQSHSHTRSMSAPNSPARSAFGGSDRGGGAARDNTQSMIHRMPSQDSLDRSIHNESGHGKSTAQIIRDLKHANSQLSAKMASMEKQYMNQLSDATRQFEQGKAKLTLELKQTNKQLDQYHLYKQSTQKGLHERDALMAKQKEESAFQRHTISDLKNQLYTLETEKSEWEEADYDKGQDMEQMVVDNQEMASVIEQLQQQVREYESNTSIENNQESLHKTGQLEDMREQWQESQVSWKRRETELQEHIESLEFTDTQVTVQLRQQLQEARDEIRQLEEQLNNYGMQAQELAASLERVQAEAQGSERYRRDEAEDLRILHDAQEQEIEKLRKDLDDAQRELELREEELEEKELDLAQRHENGEELQKLQQQLNDSLQKLDLKELDKEFNDSKESDNKSRSLPPTTTSTLTQPLSAESSEDPGLLRELEEELFGSRESITRLENELDDQSNQHKHQLDALEADVQGMEKEMKAAGYKLSITESLLADIKRQRDDAVQSSNNNASAAESGPQIQELERQMAVLTKERDEAVQTLEGLQEERKAQLSALEKQVADFKEQLATLEKARDQALAKVKSHDEENGESAKAALEEIQKEVDYLKSSVKVTSDAEKAALAKVKELETSLIELQDIRTSRDATAQQVEDLKTQLEQANMDFSKKEKAAFKIKEQEFAGHKEQVQKLNERNQELESSGNNSSSNINKIKKQLREAQIALVALDDEKKEMSAKHRELLFAVEKKKEDNLRDFSEKLEAKEKELTQLRYLEKQASRVAVLESERDELENKVKRLQSHVNRHASNGPSPEEESLRAELKTTKDQVENLNGKIQILKKENETQAKALKAKLKDRDTTIAALVRSSVSMEQKFSSMETDFTTQGSIQSVADGELNQLRKTVATTKESEMKLSKGISALQKEVRTARADAERWRAALDHDSSGKNDYRYQITMMQKEGEENYDRLQERDSAIENLVNQSMTQESHVKDLKTRISSLMKETENLRLQNNKKEDSPLKAEIHRLHQESEIFAGQIIEQDEEMEVLKRNLHARDEQVVALKKDISELKSRGSQVDASELKLRDQQVSALKLEISMLKADMKTRLNELANEKIKSREIQSAPSTSKNDSKRVIELQAEIDELQEAQETNRTELRDLRRQLYQAKEAAGEAGDLKIELAQSKYVMDEVQREAKAKIEAAQKEARDATEVHRREVDQSGLSDREDLREQLDESVSKNKALETRMASQLENLRRLKNEAVEKLEIKLRERDETIEKLMDTSTNLSEGQIQIFQSELEKLRQDLSSKSEELERLQKQLKDTASSLRASDASKQELSQELDSTKAAKDTAEKAMAETVQDIPNNDDLSKAKEALEMEVANLKTELASVQQDQENYEELKAQLEQENKTRASAEKSIVESYESQLKAINMNKDVTIDELRKNLAESRGKSSEDITEMINAIRTLESENDGLKEQLQVELNAKNQQIYALEHALHAQEQQLENMKDEMDQLQSGMEFATQKRRGEVDEMEQEVMEINTRANKQEREIVTLKMQLEEHKLEHKSEVVRLKDMIATMENESPLANTVAQLQNDDRMLEVRERLEQLKWTNTELQEQNLKLNGRLERAMLASKSLESEKEHSEDLEKEVRRLSRQVKTLEGILQGAKRPPSSARSPAAAPAPAPATAQPSRAAVDKENTKNEPVISTKRTASATPPRSRDSGSSGNKKGFGGLFKRKSKADVSTISTGQTATNGS